jgi:hypothetical protein
MPRYWTGRNSQAETPHERRKSQAQPARRHCPGARATLLTERIAGLCFAPRFNFLPHQAPPKPFATWNAPRDGPEIVLLHAAASEYALAVLNDDSWMQGTTALIPSTAIRRAGASRTELYDHYSGRAFRLAAGAAAGTTSRQAKIRGGQNEQGFKDQTLNKSTITLFPLACDQEIFNNSRNL